MSRKQAKHLFDANLFGIKEKIKNFENGSYDNISLGIGFTVFN